MGSGGGSYLYFHLLLALMARPTLGVYTCNFRKIASDQLPSTDLLANVSSVRSSTECAQICSANFRSSCRSYGYKRKSRDCQLFSVEQASTGGNPGWSYYVGCKGDTGSAGSLCFEREEGKMYVPSCLVFCLQSWSFDDTQVSQCWRLVLPWKQIIA